jgi:hypothetical protein
MSDEEWEANKSCVVKKREHKWNWLVDITTGMPHPTAVACAHCGLRANMTRDKLTMEDQQ